MKKILFLMLSLLLWSAASVAQVRIGGDTDPGNGAVLDLNESDAGGGKLGLAFPRVELTDYKQALDGKTPLNGTVIYNTNPKYARGQGLYYWVDSLWMQVGSMYAFQPGRPGDTVAILKQPIIAIPDNDVTGLGVTFGLDTKHYLESGSVFRFDWTITASPPGYDPMPYLEYTTTKQETVFVPYDATPRTYTATVKAISYGYNDSPISEPVASLNQGVFVPSYDMLGEKYFDIAVTDYPADRKYGYLALRTPFRLDATQEYEYKVAGKGTTPSFSWSIESGSSYVAGSRVENDSIFYIKFNSSVLSNGSIVGNPTAKLTVQVKCHVVDGNYTHDFIKDIEIGDRDICSATLPYTDAEGHEYYAYRFGDAGCWMTSNLRSTYTLQNGIKRTIEEDHNPSNQNKPAYFYVNGDIGKASGYGVTANETWGLLYSWSAANIGISPIESTDAFREGLTGKNSDRQGLCPNGWVVPSDWDFAKLEKEIASNPAAYSTQSMPYADAATYDFYVGNTDWRPAGGAVLTYWGRQMKSTTAVTITPNGSSNADGTGFNALLLGGLVEGAVSYYSTNTYFWSGSSGSSIVAWRRVLSSSNSGVVRGAGNKYNLYSVRCKKYEN